MTVLRAWHACRHLNTKQGTRRYLRIMSVITLIWTAIWFIPLIVTKSFPDSLPQMPTPVLTGGILFITLLFVLTITNFSLGAIYEGHETRTRIALDNTFFHLGAHWDAHGNLIRIPDITENYHVKEWVPLPLPLERKNLLIQANITPDQALLPETQTLTEEDLTITIALLGRTVFPLTMHIGSGEEY